MRIVQLSDIHLAKSNLEDLQNYYLDALVADLKNYHAEKKINAVIVTGDLIDKGGTSFESENPYEIFETQIIQPIGQALELDKHSFLFIPGNHDINRKEIDEENEYYLANRLTKDKANDKLKEMAEGFIKDNKRIQSFKEFEKTHHSGNTDYIYSNNQSFYFIEHDGFKIGFALINDSWRCSNTLIKDQHFIGNHQLFAAKKYFQTIGSKINIVAFHHPLDVLNDTESEELENILKSYDFHLALFGHKHNYKIDSLIGSSGGIIRLNGRAAFNNSSELNSKFQPGYSIVDIDASNATFSFHARKFIKNDGYRFDSDVDSIPGGSTTLKFEGQNYVPLSKSAVSIDKNLPASYSADVTRIVRLLIGKSLYPNPFIFVRELVQNAVDACDRVKEKDSYASPSILVKINTDENYFEIADEGDGMSKEILKDHFSIIGKSISQEFNDASGNFNLISQFGIGFISTFIVAQKVLISSKNDTDNSLDLTIDDVFKGFNYGEHILTGTYNNEKTGTCIRVYLKKEFNAASLTFYVKHYCRHISGLKVYHNSVLQVSEDSWGVEKGNFFFDTTNTRYDLKLTISPSSRPFIASNSGFLINTFPSQIIPHRFPFIIGGEINFAPKAIDFDLSRSNIIANKKSIEVRREISSCLKPLFSKAIQSDIPELRTAVLGYAQFYLTVIESEYKNFSDSYIDFFSKQELLNICLELWILEYQGRLLNLKSIINLMIGKGSSTIYHYQTTSFFESERAIAKYLSDRGNLLFTQTTVAVSFRDTQLGISNLAVLQIIAKELNLSIVSLHKAMPEQIEKMKMDKSILPEKILAAISRIEERASSNIYIAAFDRESTSSIRIASSYFINYAHSNFQDLMSNESQYTNEMIQIYLLGILRIDLGI